MQMAKTIFIISTSNFATLQKPVFSKRCFAQKHPQPLLILGKNFMQNASFQKTLKNTHHISSVDDLSKTNLSNIGRPFPREFMDEFTIISTHPVRWLGTNRCTFIPPLAKTSVNIALTMQIDISSSGKMTTKVNCPDHRIKNTYIVLLNSKSNQIASPSGPSCSDIQKP